MKFDIGALPSKFGKKLQRLVGSANQRFINSYSALVDEVNGLGDQVNKLSDEEVRARVAALKTEVQEGGKSLESVRAEMFALTRVASERTLGLRHYDVQLIGGAVLHDGRIAEMATGEGKTLVATLPAALNALSGKGVYVVTVNDYLAKRDRDWMAPVFEFLGLSVGAIQSNMPPAQRQEEYACDITYGTNNEFGFDYLRDNMKWQPGEQVQSRLNFAIVDEVDSILVDEARTPLIISGPPEGKADKYLKSPTASRASAQGGRPLRGQAQGAIRCLLDRGGHREGRAARRRRQLLQRPSPTWTGRTCIEQLAACPPHLRSATRTTSCAENPSRTSEVEVIIVDEFTGRLMAGRRWSDGLHQAVEAKEGLTPQGGERRSSRRSRCRTTSGCSTSSRA